MRLGQQRSDLHDSTRSQELDGSEHALVLGHGVPGALLKSDVIEHREHAQIGIAERGRQDAGQTPRTIANTSRSPRAGKA